MNKFKILWLWSLMLFASCELPKKPDLCFLSKNIPQEAKEALDPFINWTFKSQKIGDTLLLKRSGSKRREIADYADKLLTWGRDTVIVGTDKRGKVYPTVYAKAIYNGMIGRNEKVSCD